MKFRILSFLLVLAMLISCFVACNDDEEKKNNKPSESKVTVESGDTESGDNAVADEENNKTDAESTDVQEETSNAPQGEASDSIAFDSLTDNREKLVYLDGGADDYIGYDEKLYNVIGVDTESVEFPLFDENGVYKLAAGLKLAEFTVDGNDMLEEQFGGPIGADFSALVGEAGLNANAGLSLMGNTMGFDIKAGEDGILVTSPFALTKPVFVDGEFIVSLIEDNPEIQKLLEDIINLSESLTELGDNALLGSYLRSKAVELIPEEAVTADTATAEYAYIEGDVESDCVVLTLNGTQLSAIFASLRESLGKDIVFKSMVSSVWEELSSNTALLLYFFGGAMPELTDEELFEAIFSLTDEIAEELKDDSDLNIVLKRYFKDGIANRFDLTITEDGTDVDISAWDVYADGANDYGFTVKVDESDVISLVGGSAEDKATLALSVYDVITETRDFVTMDENGEYVTEESTESPDSVTNSMELVIERDGAELSCDLNMSDAVKIDYEHDEDSFNAIIYAEDTNIELDGTIVNTDDGVKINGRAEVGANDFEFTVTEKTEADESKLEESLEVELKFELEEAITVIKVEAYSLVDTDSDEDIVAATPGDDDLIIDSEAALEELYENFTEEFMGIINSINGSGEEYDEVSL